MSNNAWTGALKRKLLFVGGAVVAWTFIFGLACPTLGHWQGQYVDRVKHELQQRVPYRNPDDADLSFLDTNYYVVVSASTLGPGDITPYSRRARVLTSVMMMSVLLGIAFV